MKRRIMRLLTIITLIGLLLSISVWSASFLENQQGNKPVKDADNPADNTRLKTLREIAEERDVEVIQEDPESSEYGDLSMLIGDADMIVLGRITEQKSYFIKSGDFIETTFSVDVQRILKGNTRLTMPLTFTGYGGEVQINGHRASYKVKGFDQLKPGREYVLFLLWRPGRNGFILAGDMSGAFLVKDKARIKSLATSEANRLKLKYTSADLEAFIQEVLKHQ